MRNHILATVMLTGCFMGLVGNSLAGPFQLELEGGAVWQTVNDVQIPNSNQGSRFSLVDLAGKGPQPAYRAYLSYKINDKHSLRGLFAPLQFTETGQSSEAVMFNGDNFLANQDLEATYKFNSYRITYAYRIYKGDAWRWDLGFTAKIRDAKIQLVQGSVDSSKDDLGFVPLLHLRAEARLSSRMQFLLDIDALAGGPGRAEDVSLKLGYNLSEKVQVRLGYRTVEGGADVDEVYNFAWLHFAVGSLVIDL